MKLSSAPPILSRILMAMSAIILVGVSFIIISRALEPADIIPATPPKTAETFNPKADVSKNSSFTKLKDSHMDPVPDMPLGRDNPFNSVEPTIATTTAVPRSGLRLAPVATTTQ